LLGLRTAYILWLSVDGGSKLLLRHALSIGVLLIGSCLCQGFSNSGV
jgi:hypothetical protein